MRKIYKWLTDHHVPVRLLLSVMAGIALSSVLSLVTHELLHLAGIFPPLKEPMFDKKLLIISLCYHSLYAIIAGAVTARIAEKQAMKAAFLLGSKEAIMWLLGIILLWKHSAPWFNLTKAILGIPLALLGGKLYAWYHNKHSADHEKIPEHTK